MRMVPACLRALAAGAVLACLVAPALLSAAPAAPDKDEKTGNPLDKIRKDLERTVTFKIEKQPLSAAIEMLRDKGKINIVVDNLTIQQQLGFLPDQSPVPVDAEFKDAKVRSALRSILASYGLSYAVIGDAIVVTTEDMAMLRQMRQRVNVDLTKVELTGALRQLAKDTGTNVILDSRAEKDAAAKVSLQLEDVPLETAVRLLSEMAGLKPVRVGNVLFVTKKETANELRADPDLVQPGQPGQPNPPGAFPPIAVAPNPPVIIGPQPPPGVPPAVDPDKEKPADPKPSDDKPKSDPPDDKKDK